MISFAQTTAPTKPKNNIVRYVALVYAALLIVMAVSQLFKFDEFVPLLQSFGLGSDGAVMVLASLIVVAEVFALPFLLGMYVSPLMRLVSMVLGWLVAAAWLYIVVVLSVTVNAVSDVGLLGSAVTVPSGWWNIGYGVVLVILAGWASWGLWPGATSPKRSKK